MEAKLNSVIEAYKRLEFDQAARLVQELEGKKDKAKAKLNDDQQFVLSAVKSASLLKLGRYGEAHRIMQTINLSAMKQLDMLPIFMDNTAELHLNLKETDLIGLQQKQKDKDKYGHVDGKEYPLLKSYISTRRFSQASKFCLKLYESSKSEVHFFWQVYLEFLHVLSKNDLLMGKKQCLVKTKPNLPLQFIQLFWTKFLSLFSIDSLIDQKKPIVEDVIRFYVRLLITQYKFKEAAEALQKYGRHISDPIALTDFYRSIYNIEQKQQWLDLLIAQYELLFRSNMNVANYHPLYDLYNDYLNLLVVSGLKGERLVLSDIDKSIRFDSQKTSNDKLSFYVSSLICEFKDITRPESDTKLDYYKTSVKTLLLQIITAMNKIEPNHLQKQYYLQQYVKHFGRTYTFCEEFILLCPDGCDLKLEQEGYSPESMCILNNNRHKLDYLWKRRPTPKTLQELLAAFDEYTRLYRTTLNDIDTNRILEKGERYTADQYIIILSDLFREYAEQTRFQSIDEPILNLILFLESVSRRSPYNYSLKLRLIYFYQRLNLNDRILSIYETLDIKSVQFETLGYLIYAGMLTWGQEKEYEELLVRAIKSYQDNLREIRLYAYRSLERNRLYNLEEFLSYDDFTNRSYSRLILYLLMANKHRNSTNQNYFIEKIISTLSTVAKLTFSCDYKRLYSTVNIKRQVCTFFGVYNSRDVLLNECALKLEQINIINEKYDTKPVQIKETTVNSVMDFSQFEFLRETYIYTPVKSTEEAILEQSFNCIGLLHQLQSKVSSLSRLILTKQQIDPIKHTQQLNHLIKQLGQYNSDTRELLTIQRSLSNSITLINYSLSTLSSKKKKKEEEKKLAENLRVVRQSLYSLICGYEPKPDVIRKIKLWDKQLEAEFKELEVRLGRLDKLTSTTAKQYDGMYRIN